MSAPRLDLDDPRVRRAVDLRFGGWEINRIAAELGVHRATVLRWLAAVRRARDGRRRKRAEASGLVDAYRRQYGDGIE